MGSRTASGVPMMVPMKPERLLLASIVVLLLGAACAQPSERSAPTIEPQAVLSDALANAYGVDTFHQEFQMSFSADGQEFSLTGTADVDNARQRASMTMDLGLLGGTMDMVVAEGIVYMRSPMMGGQVDTPWVRMDLAEVNPAAAAQLSGGMGGATDASSYAALLAGVVDAREDGREVVGGVETTRFVGTIDVVKAARGVAAIVGDELGPDAQEQLERSMLQLKVLGLRMIPFEAWVDDEGLLRRERFSMDLGLMPGAQGGSIEMTMDFSDYGEPVRIEVPPKSQVTDITKLLASQGSA